MSSQPTQPSPIRRLIIVALAVTVLVASLHPYFLAGFFTDDCLNSQVAVTLQRQGQTPTEYAMAINRGWMSNVGRFYPVSWWIGYHFYYWFQSVAAARLAHLALVFANVAVFAALLGRFWNSASAAILFIPVICGLFQNRQFFDPIAGYAWFMQLMLIWCAAPAFLLIEYHRQRRAACLWLALLAYAAGLLSYEIALTFLPLYFLISWSMTRSMRAAIRSVSGFLALAAIYCAWIAYLRLHRTGAYLGTEPGNLYEFFSAYAQQLSASLPLSYFAATPSLRYDVVKHFGIHSLSTKLSTYLGALLVWIGLSKAEEEGESGRIPRELLWVGAGLFFLPGLLIAASKRWQTSLGWGLGYLPVYLSYFGTAILMIGPVRSWMASRFFGKLPYLARQSVKIALTALMGLVIFLNQSSNLVITENMNREFKYPRERLQKAYEGGMASLLAPGSTLVMLQSHEWLTPDLSVLTSKRVSRVISLADFLKEPSFRQSGAPYYLVGLGYNSGESADGGWILLSEISRRSSGTLRLARPSLYVEKPGFPASAVHWSCGAGERLVPLHFDSDASGRKPAAIVPLPDLACAPDQLAISIR